MVTLRPRLNIFGPPGRTETDTSELLETSAPHVPAILAVLDLTPVGLGEAVTAAQAAVMAAVVASSVAASAGATSGNC